MALVSNGHKQIVSTQHSSKLLSKWAKSCLEMSRKASKEVMNRT